MDQGLREVVRRRADNAGEYCRMPQQATPLIAFHVEHIVSKQHGGTDVPGGLALPQRYRSRRNQTEHLSFGKVPERSGPPVATISGEPVMGQVNPVVMVNKAKANTIQPPCPAQYVPVDRGVGKEVDQRVRRDTESVGFNCVAVGFKRTVGDPETLANSAGQNETKSLSDLGSEQTE